VFTARYGLGVYIRFRLIKIPLPLLRTTTVSILTSSYIYILIFILLLLEGRAGEAWKPSNKEVLSVSLSLSLSLSLSSLHPTSLLPRCSFYSPILQLTLSFSVLGNNRCLLRLPPSLPCHYHSTIAGYSSSFSQYTNIRVTKQDFMKIPHCFQSMNRFSRLRRKLLLAFVNVDRKRWRNDISVHTLRPTCAHI
jgi:hypothetical protein